MFEVNQLLKGEQKCKRMKNVKNSAFSINFRVNKQRVKNGKPAIYLRVTVGKQRAEIATHHYINASQWEQKLQCAKGIRHRNDPGENRFPLRTGDFTIKFALASKAPLISTSHPTYPLEWYLLDDWHLQDW